MLDNTNKTSKKFFAVATSLLALSFLPACSFDKPEMLETIIHKNLHATNYKNTLFPLPTLETLKPVFKRGFINNLSKRMFGKSQNIPRNLSPTRREALIPHSLIGKGARGLGSRNFEVKHNTFQISSSDGRVNIPSRPLEIKYKFSIHNTKQSQWKDRGAPTTNRERAGAGRSNIAQSPLEVLPPEALPQIFVRR